MAEAKESTKTVAPKAPRKKPERKAPKQSDFPNKLAWLKAMTEHEEAEAAKATTAKIARLDKRLASKRSLLDTLKREVDAIVAEIAELGGFDTEAESVQPQG